MSFMADNSTDQFCSRANIQAEFVIQDNFVASKPVSSCIPVKSTLIPSSTIDNVSVHKVQRRPIKLGHADSHAPALAVITVIWTQWDTTESCLASAASNMYAMPASAYDSPDD